MTKILSGFTAAGLAMVLACASTENKPTPAPTAAPAPKAVAAPKTDPAPVAVAPAPEPKPAVVVAPAPVVKPAPVPAPVVKPAEPEPAKKKVAKGPLGLIAIAVLKEEVGLDAKQLKKCREIYAEYKVKTDEASAKVKAAEDKKAVNKEIAPLKAEILAKLREVCDDTQKKKFDELTLPKRKQKK